jgi:uncharacterized protein with GYD domain
MATFISLVNFTQQGIKDFKDSPARAAKLGSMAEKAGAKVKKVYWTIGSFDALVVMEAPNDETAAAVMLGLGSLGNVRTQTLRAFDSSEIKEIISKVPG